MATIRLHRFHNKVAISVGTGETTYLTIDEAKELGSQLNQFIRDLHDKPFAKSAVGTWEKEIDGTSRG